MSTFEFEIRRDGGVIILDIEITQSGSPGVWGLPESSEPAEAPEWEIASWTWEGSGLMCLINLPDLSEKEQEAITELACAIEYGMEADVD